MVKPVRMVLVGGADRSGSTLVSLLLGAAPGAFAVGETMSVWGDGVLHNRPCSCGAPFRDCPFWIRVGNDAFGGWDEAEAWRLKRAQRGGVRGMRRIARARLVGERGAPELTDLAEARERLYRSIASVSGSNVIIESSKNPYFSYQLSRLVGCEARMVHLIRDPRGTVFSWQRTKFAPHPLPEAARSWFA